MSRYSFYVTLWKTKWQRAEKISRAEIYNKICLLSTLSNISFHKFHVHLSRLGKISQNIQIEVHQISLRLESILNNIFENRRTWLKKNLVCHGTFWFVLQTALNLNFKALWKHVFHMNVSDFETGNLLNPANEYPFAITFKYDSFKCVYITEPVFWKPDAAENAVKWLSYMSSSIYNREQLTA